MSRLRRRLSKPLVMFSVNFHPNNFRPTRRKLLTFLCVICLILFVLVNQEQRQRVFVLKGGFPMKRLLKTSAQYEPLSRSKLAFSLKLSSTVPWHMSQDWEPYAVNESVGNLRYPNCSRLLRGDAAIQREAQSFMADHIPFTRSDLDYIRDTRDCKQFVRERGYIMDASEKEKEFPIAFSILFYKDLEQMERLLRAVYRPHNSYCIHLDKKSPRSTWRALRGIAACLDNVYLASKPISVEWGTFSVLQPELVCMQDLWANKTWKYFINLTGQEYPLKTNLQLVDILRALNGSNDVDCTTSWIYQERWYNNFPAPHDIRPMKGSLHIAASRAFVDYMLHSTVAKDFLEWVSFTEFPDETFFSSLNHNPQLRVPGSYLGPPDTDAKTKPYLSRFKNWGKYWQDGQGRLNFNWSCHGKRVRSICVFGVGDLPLLTSRKEMFANKFHLDFEPLTLDCLEEWLWNTTMDEYSGRVRFDNSFYRKLDIASHHVTVPPPSPS